MKKIYNNDEYSPYHPSTHQGKEEKMSTVRGATIICLTLLVCVALFIYYGSIDNRYKFIKEDSGFYIFDKTSTVTNYCNTENCKGLSAGLIIPQKHQFERIPGTPVLPNPVPPLGGSIAYLPIQTNQAYVLQPVQTPMPMQQAPAPMAEPAPQPQMAPAEEPPAPIPSPAPMPEQQMAPNMNDQMIAPPAEPQMPEQALLQLPEPMMAPAPEMPQPMAEPAPAYDEDMGMEVDPQAPVEFNSEDATNLPQGGFLNNGDGGFEGEPLN